MKEKPFVLRTALAVVTSTALLIGCASRNNTISQAERRDDGRPGFEETRARAGRAHLSGDAPLLAEGDTPFDPAAE